MHDKQAMRARLRAVGIEDTPAALVTDRETLPAFAAEHGLPLAVKPNGGVASVGVSVARITADLDACFAKAVAEHDAFSAPGVLAERFFEGPQFSIEGFSEDGEHVFVAIARKYSDPVTFSELGHVLPAPLSPAGEKLIQDYARDVLDALGVRFGPTHTEFVLTPEGPRIIETHLRLSSDTGPLVPGATGVDLVESQLRQTMGEKVLPGIRRTLEESSAAGRYGAVRYANTDLAGHLVKIVGIGSSCTRPRPSPTASEAGKPRRNPGNFCDPRHNRASNPVLLLGNYEFRRSIGPPGINDHYHLPISDQRQSDFTARR